MRDDLAMSDSASVPSFRAVVGTDGSANSNAALEWALRETALRGGGEVVALMTWTYPPSAAAGFSFGGGLPAADAMSAATTEALEEVLATVTAPDGVTLTPKVREGAASTALIEEGAHSDLIVVGKRGHGGFLGLVLGSVADQVAGHAPCPVVIVPGDH
jgi:nucleotide-binding universal stress UspA family protein